MRCGVQIDPKSHVPIYLQIAEGVRSRVAAAVYRPGESLPSLRNMAIELQVNPNTVQRAYDELERDGLIYSEARRGVVRRRSRGGVGPGPRDPAHAKGLRGAVADGRSAGVSVEQMRAVFEVVSNGGLADREGIVMNQPAMDKSVPSEPATWARHRNRRTDQAFRREDGRRSAATHRPARQRLRTVGSNGAGKTTTLKMLMGMVSITEGEARVLGEDVASQWLAVRQRVGYVPEMHHVCPWMWVGEAIGFCRAQYATWNDATCRELLEVFKLDPNPKSKTPVQRDGGEAVAALGGVARSGGASTGRAAFRIGPDRAGRMPRRRAAHLRRAG